MCSWFIFDGLLKSFLSGVRGLRLVPGLGRELEMFGFEIEEMMQRARSEYKLRAGRTARNSYRLIFEMHCIAILGV